jgi:nitrogen fixation protein NifU and related proteins
MMDRALREAIIMDYARDRPGKGFDQRTDAGQVPEPTPSGFREVHRRNPLCGDEVTLRLEFGPEDPPVVARFRWEGRGCTVSQASAAMLATYAEGKTPAGLRALSGEVRELISLPDTLERPALGAQRAPDVAALAGIGRLPLRARCAALAWDALDAVLDAGNGPLRPPGGPGAPGARAQ